MKRLFWLLFPDCRLKRAWCGGFWTRYQTSLPMPSVWHQGATVPGRLPCQMGGHLEYADHGTIHVAIHG